MAPSSWARCRSLTNHVQKPQKATSSRGLEVGVPRGERDVAGDRRRATGVRDQGPPEIATAGGVLHVHVDLDVGAGNLDPVETSPPIGGSRTGAGPGQVDLRGEVGGARTAQGEGHPVDGAQVRHGAQAVGGQVLELLLAVGDDVAQRGPRWQVPRPSMRWPRSTLRRASSAVVQSRAARSWRSSIPCALYNRRRAAPIPEIRLRSATSSISRAAPVPPPAHAARRARDGLGQQRRRPVVGVLECGQVDGEPVRELEVVELHGAQSVRRGHLEVLRGVEAGLVEVVPDDHALGAVYAAEVAGRRGEPGPLQQPAVVGQLQQVVGPPTGVVVGVGGRRLERGRRQLRHQGRPRRPAPGPGRAPCAT